MKLTQKSFCFHLIYFKNSQRMFGTTLGTRQGVKAPLTSFPPPWGPQLSGALERFKNSASWKEGYPPGWSTSSQVCMGPWWAHFLAYFIDSQKFSGRPCRVWVVWRSPEIYPWLWRHIFSHKRAVDFSKIWEWSFTHDCGWFCWLNFLRNSIKQQS